MEVETDIIISQRVLIGQDAILVIMYLDETIKTIVIALICNDIMCELSVSESVP